MDSVEGILVLLLHQERTMQINERIATIAARGTTIGITRDIFTATSEEHGGKCRSGMPPQSLPLPLTEKCFLAANTTPMHGLFLSSLNSEI
jgi:hypothetical protein